MSAQATILFFGLYVFSVGVALMFFPGSFVETVNIVLKTTTVSMYAGVLPQPDGYIGFFGVVVTILGLYYIAAAVDKNKLFYQYTCWGRILVFIFTVIQVVSGGAAPVFLVFGTVDLCAAMFTIAAVNKEMKAQNRQDRVAKVNKSK